MTAADSVVSSSEGLWLIPGKLFRVRVLECPPGVREADLDSWVRFAVEEDSPLALESILWGYWKLGSTVLVYVAWKNRVEAEIGRTVGADAVRVVPAFLLPRPESSEGAQPLDCVIQTGSECYRVRYAAGETLPAEVASAPADAASHVLEKVEGGERLTFYYRNADGRTAEATLRGERMLLRADVRKGADMSTRHAEDKQLRTVQTILLTMAGALVLLLLLQGLVLLLDTMSGQRRVELESRSGEIDAIRARHQLTERLERVQSRPWSPFDQLALLEHYRQNGIYFTAVTAVAAGNTEVRGQAASVEQVNQYLSALETAPQVRFVELTEIVSSSGGVVFRLTLRFDEGTVAAT